MSFRRIKLNRNGASPGRTTHTWTRQEGSKDTRSVTLLKFSKLQIKVHLVDMVKIHI